LTYKLKHEVSCRIADICWYSGARLHALVAAFLPVHDLIKNVLNRQPGSQETNALAVHQLEQVAAGAVHASDVFQVNRDLPAGLADASRVPAALQFGHEGPRQ